MSNLQPELLVHVIVQGAFLAWPISLIHSFTLTILSLLHLNHPSLHSRTAPWPNPPCSPAQAGISETQDSHPQLDIIDPASKQFYSRDEVTPHIHSVDSVNVAPK